MKFSYLKFSLPVAVIILFGSCQKELDFDMVDDLTLSPQGTLPLVNAKLTLADLVTDIDTLLVIDPDDALRVYYQQDSIFNYGVKDLVKIPDQDPESITITRNLPALSLATSLGTLGGAEIDSVDFFKGQLEYTMSASAPLPDSIKVRFEYVNSDAGNGLPFRADIVLPANQTTVLDSASLSNVFFDLSDGGIKVNFIRISLAVLNVADLPPGVDLDISVRLKSLEVQSAEGFFGERVEQAPPGNFELGINGLENFVGGFVLTNPQVKLTVTTTAGLPVGINSNFTGVNLENTGEPLSPPDFTINAAPNVATPTVSILTVDKDNSNIVNFLANIPNQVFYSGGVSLNPNGRPTIPNFVDRNSEVNVDLEVNVPLEVRLENMRLDEVINDVDIAAGGNEDFIESITLFLASENRLPFDLTLSVSFLDSLTADSTGGFTLDFLQAAPTDADGKVTGPNIFNNEIELDEQQIASLLGANAVRIRAAVSTANDGSKVAKLFATDGLEVKIASKAKFNVKPSEL